MQIYKTKRNRAIYRLHKEKKISFGQIAKIYNLNVKTIFEIWQRELVKRGELTVEKSKILS